LIAQKIEENYNNFDGFVVIHGTDTLAYTASLLSFMLENLGKPVIFTGSIKPLSMMGNDAVDNLICSFNLAS
jgi:L-asparaginase